MPQSTQVLLDSVLRVILSRIFNLHQVMEVLFILGLVEDMQDVVLPMFRQVLPFQDRVVIVEMV